MQDIADLIQAGFKDVKVESQLQDTPVEQPVIQEQPKVETPVVAPTTDTPAPTVETPTEQPQNTQADYFFKQFGFENEDGLKSALEKAKNYDTLQANYQTLEEQSKQSQFKTEFGKVADELHAKGVKPETIAKFHGLNMEALSDFDKLKLKTQVEFPNLPEATIEAALREKYDITDELLTDGAKAQRQMQLAQDGANAAEFLTKHIYSTFNPEAKVDPNVAAREQARVGYWNNELPKLQPLSLNRESTIKFHGANGVVEEKLPFTYTPSAETTTKVMEQFKQMATNPNFASIYTPDQQGINTAQQTLRNMFWAAEGENIVNALLKHTASVESKIHQSYAERLGSPVGRNANVAVATTGNTVQDKVSDIASSLIQKLS